MDSENVHIYQTKGKHNIDERFETTEHRESIAIPNIGYEVIAQSGSNTLTFPSLD